MKRYLILHKAAKHEGVKYLCGDCDFHARKLHKEIQHEYDRYSCYLCDFRATGKKNLKYTRQFQHEELKYSCNNC